MSDLATRLSSIEAKKQKLKNEEIRLIQKRKLEISEIAEKFGLLVAPDFFMLGLFQEAKVALENKNEFMKNWIKQGEILFKSKKSLSNARKTQKHSTPAQSLNA